METYEYFTATVAVSPHAGTRGCLWLLHRSIVPWGPQRSAAKGRIHTPFRFSSSSASSVRA